MLRIPTALILLSAVCEAAAFQCRPMSQVIGEAPVIFTGRADEMVRRSAVALDQPEIAGTPRRYDLIRFAVIEQLKGDTPASIDLLCPGDDMRCKPGAERRPLVIALPAPTAPGAPQKLFCNFDYLEQGPGTRTPDTTAVNGMIEKLRAGRKKPQ